MVRYSGPRHRLALLMALVCLAFAAPATMLAATPAPPTTATAKSQPPNPSASSSVRRAASGTPDAIGIFRIISGVGVWALRDTLSSGYPTTFMVYGLPGDIPLMCDWDGNGTRTPGIFRIVSGMGVWAVRNSNTNGPPDAIYLYGLPGDIPVCGDWTGQGRQTIGIVRDVGGTLIWALRNSNGTGAPDIVAMFGQAGDIPVVGDWTGQGKQTIGVARANSSYPDPHLEWRLRNSNVTGTPDVIFNWGTGLAMPVIGDWTGQGTTLVGAFYHGTWSLASCNFDSRCLPLFNAAGPWYGITGDTPLVYR